VHLSWGQVDANWTAICIDKSMDLRRQAAAGTSHAAIVLIPLLRQVRKRRFHHGGSNQKIYSINRHTTGVGWNIFLIYQFEINLIHSPLLHICEQVLTPGAALSWRPTF